MINPKMIDPKYFSAIEARKKTEIGLSPINEKVMDDIFNEIKDACYCGITECKYNCLKDFFDIQEHVLYRLNKLGYQTKIVKSQNEFGGYTTLEIRW